MYPNIFIVASEIPIPMVSRLNQLYIYIIYDICINICVYIYISLSISVVAHKSPHVRSVESANLGQSNVAMENPL